MSVADTDKTVAAAVQALASALDGVGAIGTTVSAVKRGVLPEYRVSLVLSTPAVARTVVQALPDGVTVRECVCGEEPPGTHVHFNVRL